MRGPRDVRPLLRLACILAALLSPNALANTKSSSAASSAAAVGAAYAGPHGHVVAGIPRGRVPPCCGWLALRGGRSPNNFRILPGLEGGVLRGGAGGRAKGGGATGGGGTTLGGAATGGETEGDGSERESEGMSLGDSDVEMGGSGGGARGERAEAKGSGTKGGRAKGSGEGGGDSLGSGPSGPADVEMEGSGAGGGGGSSDLELDSPHDEEAGDNRTYPKYVPGGDEDALFGGPWEVDADYGGGPDGTGPLIDPMYPIMLPEDWTPEDRKRTLEAVEFPPFPVPEQPRDWLASTEDFDAMPAFDFSSHAAYSAPSATETDASTRNRVRSNRESNKMFGHVSVASSTEQPESESKRLRRLWRRELLEASLLGEAAKVRELVTGKGVDVNYKCAASGVVLDDNKWLGENRTALHFACMNHFDSDEAVETVTTLLELGADVSAITDGGDTPLHFAAMRGNYNMATRLLQAGADPTAVNHEIRLPYGGRGFTGEGETVKKEGEEESCSDIDDEGAEKMYQTYMIDILFQMFGEVPKGEEAACSPPMTPYQISVLAQHYSTDETREVLQYAQGLWEEAGSVDVGKMAAHMTQYLADRNQKQEEFDLERGFTEEAMSLKGDDCNVTTMNDFCPEAWQKITECYPHVFKEGYLEGIRRRDAWDKQEAAAATFDFKNYYTPEDVHPNGKAYPDDVPIAAREWCLFSSGEWAHPDFKGEIVKDFLDNPHWPQKHDWEKTPEHPDGLWELFPAGCTRNLTEPEKERCRIGTLARTQQEDKWFADPHMRASSRMWRAIDGNEWPYENSWKDKPDDDPWDRFVKENAKKPDQERPWFQLQRALEEAKAERARWERKGRPTMKAGLTEGDASDRADTVLISAAIDPTFLSSAGIAGPIASYAEETKWGEGEKEGEEDESTHRATDSDDSNNFFPKNSLAESTEYFL